MFVLFPKGTLSANFDLHDCDERGMGKSMSCFIAPVREGTESSLPLRKCAWYVLSSSHVSLRCSVYAEVIVINHVLSFLHCCVQVLLQAL